jgi:hypothetical protein
MTVALTTIFLDTFRLQRLSHTSWPSHTSLFHATEVVRLRYAAFHPPRALVLLDGLLYLILHLVLLPTLRNLDLHYQSLIASGIEPYIGVSQSKRPDREHNYGRYTASIRWLTQQAALASQTSHPRI